MPTISKSKMDEIRRDVIRAYFRAKQEKEMCETCEILKECNQNIIKTRNEKLAIDKTGTD